MDWEAGAMADGEVHSFEGPVELVKGWRFAPGGLWISDENKNSF